MYGICNRKQIFLILIKNIFDHINTALVSIRDFQNIRKHFIDTKLSKHIYLHALNYSKLCLVCDYTNFIFSYVLEKKLLHDYPHQPPPPPGIENSKNSIIWSNQVNFTWSHFFKKLSKIHGQGRENFLYEIV